MIFQLIKWNWFLKGLDQKSIVWSIISAQNVGPLLSLNRFRIYYFAQFKRKLCQILILLDFIFITSPKTLNLWYNIIKSERYLNFLFIVSLFFSKYSIFQNFVIIAWSFEMFIIKKGNKRRITNWVALIQLVHLTEKCTIQRNFF